LKWEGSDPDSDTISYKLYFGTNLTQVQDENDLVRVPSEIMVNYYNLTDLLNDTVYYWTVIPFDGSVFGPCLNGTWMFRVIIKAEKPEPPEDFLFEIDSGLKSDLNSGEITDGIKENFTSNGVTLSDEAELNKEGSMWKIVDGNKAYDIKEENGKLNVYEGEVPTDIEDVDDDDDDDDGGLMMAVGIAIVIIIIILILIFMVFMKPKKPEEAGITTEEERIEGEESIPAEAGIGEEVPEGEEAAPMATAVGLTPEQVAGEGEAVPEEGVPVEPTLPGSDEPSSKIVAAPVVKTSPTVSARPVAAQPVESEPGPETEEKAEEAPVPLDAKPSACPICNSENLEFGEGNTGKCTVCENEFSWKE
jgi:hypothetical protein